MDGSQIIIAASTLIGALSGIWLGSFLEEKRTKRSILLESKQAVYSKILVGMSSSFIPDENLTQFLKDPDFRSKIRLRAGELLTQGRLLASEPLVNKLRELYHCEQQIWDNLEKSESVEDLTRVRGRLAYEIEIMMKKEIGT